MGLYFGQLSMKASKTLPLVNIEFADSASPDALRGFAAVGLVADFRAPSADTLPSMYTVDLMIRREERNFPLVIVIPHSNKRNHTNHRSSNSLLIECDFVN